MADRYLTVFTVEVDAVHDGHPQYFADLLTAELNEAMRLRGATDCHVMGMGWRVVVGPDDEPPETVAPSR